MKFAAVFALGIFAFVAQARAIAWEGSIDIGESIGALKKNVLEAREFLQHLISSESILENAHVYKVTGEVNDKVIGVGEEFLDKICKLEDKLGKIGQSERVGPRIDALKKELIEVRKNLGTAIKTEAEFVNYQIEIAAGRINTEVIIAAKKLITKIFELEINLTVEVKEAAKDEAEDEGKDDEKKDW